MNYTKENYPQGQVTFLFTDLVGSTQMWEAYPQTMPQTLARHDALLKEAVTAHQGRIVKTTGDGILAAFESPFDAVSAAIEGQKQLATEAWLETAPLSVRMGLHTGESHFREEDYFGSTLNRAARIMSLGYGEQILLSEAVWVLLKNSPSLPFKMLDLGEYRLKGVGKAEKIYQIVHPDLPSQFPALRSSVTTPNNLPLQMTEFIGREREIASIVQRFPETRLLTFTGPGGTGKTRLALQTATELLDKFTDGVFFVDLILFNDVSLVLSSIAETLKVREVAKEPILETLKKFLEQKQLLLVLDNFEHIMEAAPVVGELLAAAPKVSAMITSREVLHISGEQVYAVQPLVLPKPGAAIDLKQFLSYEGIQLFINRARAANPAFHITPENAGDVAEICRHLDGLPLAIELAAARARLFTPKKLLERLSDRLQILTGGARDLHSRQQTLRGAIDWSYNLLEQPERKLFARLEVFSGGRSIEAIEVVCGRDLGIDILDGLESLLDKSLILQEEDFEGQPRIFMLESLHAYASERHREFDDWEKTRASHAKWVLAFAEAGEKGLFGQTPGLWVDRLRVEEGNIRAVLERCQSGEISPEIGVRLVGALRYYWEWIGKLGEGTTWLESMLAISSHLPPAVRAKALCGVAVLSYWRGDSQKSAEYCEKALEAGQEIGDMVIVGEAQHFLGHAAQGEGKHDLGVELLTKSHQNFIAIDHRWGVRRSRACLADALRLQQDYDLAAHNFELTIREQRERSSSGGDIMMAMYLSNYGNVLNRQGKYEEAGAKFREAIQLSHALNNALLVAFIVDGLAGNSVLSGHPEEAALLMGAAERIFEAENVFSLPAIDKFDHDFYLAEIQSSLTPDRLEALWKKGKDMSVEEMVDYVLGGASLKD